MSKENYPENKPPKHSTVRIPRPMADAVEEFLKTERAKQMGFIYKVDVVTAAVRDLLEKYSFYEETCE